MGIDFSAKNNNMDIDFCYETNVFYPFKGSSFDPVKNSVFI